MAKRRNNAQRWSPQDLPYQVDLFIEENQRRMGSRMDTQAMSPLFRQHGVLNQLAHNKHTTWVDDNLVKLITSTAPTVPAWTPGHVMTNSGFMAFNTPLFDDTTRERSEDDHPFSFYPAPVDALAWIKSTSEKRDTLTVFVLTRTDNMKNAQGLMRRGAERAPFVLLHSFDMDARHTYRHTPIYAETLDSDAPDDVDERQTRLISTALLLVNQPDIVTELTDESVTLPAKRRPLRRSTPDKHKTQLPDVKVRYLTVLPRVRQDVDASEAEHAGLQRGALTQRHWVRGHWRQQPCGPGRTQIKPVYIKPHLRGPDHAPIDDRPSVNRMDR